VDELEPRLVPAHAAHFINHGGPVLAHVEVEDVFLGSGWQANPGLKQQIDQYMTYLVDSPYMDTLAQYGVGHGELAGSVVLPQDLGNEILSSQVDQLVEQDVADGTLPPNDANRLYFLFTAPGVSVTDSAGQPPDFLGYHTSVGSQNAQVAYAIVPYPRDPNPSVAGLDEFQSLTETSSHELAESCTDPYSRPNGLPSGWCDYTFDPTAPQQGEIADIADDTPVVYLKGYAVEQLWSNQADACVAPAGSTLTPPSASLTVRAQGVSDATAGQPFTGQVAAGSDIDPLAGTLTATVDWGDGTVDQNVPVQGPDAGGNFTVTGTHTYTSAGQYPLRITVSDGDGNTASDTAMATVAAPSTKFTVQTPDITATADQPFSGVVAQVTDTAPGVTAADLTATISWGDGSSDTVSVTGSNGQFTVSGTHTYQSAGSDKVTVVVHDSASGATATGTGTATVQPAPVPALTAAGQGFTATAGSPFSGAVALVQDANPAASPATLTATIDWGDGSPVQTVALVATNVPGQFTVAGSHTYTQAGARTLAVAVTDTADGATASTSAAVVVQAPPPAPSPPVPQPPPSGTIVLLAPPPKHRPRHHPTHHPHHKPRHHPG
jgi:hypothetical protein